MFRVTKTQHVLAVVDLAPSEQYFVEKLGMEVRLRVDGWSFLSRDGFHVMLGHCPGETPARDTHNHSYFAYVNCEGIDDLYRECVERGATFEQHLADKPWGMREFGVATPEGHRIMFGQELGA